MERTSKRRRLSKPPEPLSQSFIERGNHDGAEQVQRLHMRHVRRFARSSNDGSLQLRQAIVEANGTLATIEVLSSTSLPTGSLLPSVTVAEATVVVAQSIVTSPLQTPSSGVESSLVGIIISAALAASTIEASTPTPTSSTASLEAPSTYVSSASLQTTASPSVTSLLTASTGSIDSDSSWSFVSPTSITSTSVLNTASSSAAAGSTLSDRVTPDAISTSFLTGSLTATGNSLSFTTLASSSQGTLKPSTESFTLTSSSETFTSFISSAHTTTSAVGEPSSATSTAAGVDFSTLASGNGNEPAGSSSTGTAASGAAISTNTLGPSTTEDTNSSSVPTPTVVGSVVGGIAGISLLLLAALFFLRRLKRRRRLQAQPGMQYAIAPSAPENTPFAPTTASAFADQNTAAESGARDGGLAGTATAGAAAGFIRRISRTRPNQPPDMQERGFERLSGRKLPSLFSPGMEGPAGSGPGRSYPSGGTFNSASSYDDPFNDSNDAMNPFAGNATAARTPSRRPPSEEERFLPGPARTPTVHHGAFARTSHLAAPLMPTTAPEGNRSPAPASQRSQSHASFDTNRGSRFTEDIV